MLYNKHRPKCFKELIGQELTKKLLINFLTSQENIHSFIFFGPNGTGKTTAARLFAQAINCSKFQILRELCRECDPCKSIEQELCTDIVEIDGATHNGVEYIREIIKNSIYPPLTLSKKLYIIDEAHCLSYQAWNALLKLIEEPPEHLVLIFLTTAINKIIPTILSRCQKLFFSPIETKDLNQLLCSIATAENKKINSEIISQLSENARGSAREAIVSLEQILIDAESTNQVLGNFSNLEEEAKELLDLVISSSYLKAIDKLQKNLNNSNKLFELILDKLLELSFYQLSSSKEVLRSIAEEQAKDLLKNSPNLNSMINFLAPALSSGNTKYSLAYSKFLLINLFEKCSISSSQPVLSEKTNLTLPKREIKKEELKKIIQPQLPTESKAQTHESLTLGTLLSEAIVQKSKVEDLPKSKDLFQHSLIKFESIDLPQFKFDSLVAEEKEIISLLRRADKSIGKENYSILKNYLESPEHNENRQLIITQLFQEMLSKYELICSNTSECIVVFPTEVTANYFNLKIKNLEIIKELYKIFDSSIKWKGITLSELQTAIKKNKSYKFTENRKTIESTKDTILLTKIKETFLTTNKESKFLA